MKQTAVEWLEENLIFRVLSEEDFKHNKECWIKAKEMEKQQIIEAHGNQTKKASPLSTYIRTGERYYNETFKKD